MLSSFPAKAVILCMSIHKVSPIHFTTQCSTWFVKTYNNDQWPEKLSEDDHSAWYPNLTT